MITTTSLIEAFRAEGLGGPSRDMALLDHEDLARVVARLNAQANQDLVAALELVTPLIRREIAQGRGLFQDSDYETCRAAIQKHKEGA